MTANDNATLAALAAELQAVATKLAKLEATATEHQNVLMAMADNAVSLRQQLEALRQDADLTIEAMHSRTPH